MINTKAKELTENNISSIAERQTSFSEDPGSHFLKASVKACNICNTKKLHLMQGYQNCEKKQVKMHRSFKSLIGKQYNGDRLIGCVEVSYSYNNRMILKKHLKNM